MTWPHEEIFHTWWVEPEQFLAGEYPGAPTRAKATAKLRMLDDAGVDTIIDLTDGVDGLEPYSHLLDEITAVNGRSIRHYRYPIPDNHVIDDAGYDDILARLRSELNSGRTVYLHCWGGRGRTSTVVGCWLIEQGLDYDATIARLKELRCNTRKSHVSVPESPSQHEVLRRRANLLRPIPPENAAGERDPGHRRPE